MAQDITLLGAAYSDVPAVELPKTGGGIATFIDVTDVPTKTSDLTNDGDDGVNAFVAFDDAATSSTYGLVKTNPNEGVTLNASGQLDISGRIGQMPDSTGVYVPKTIQPTAVENGSLLLTEGSGTSVGGKSLSVTTGFGTTLATTATAGATTYQITNNYQNRIICAALAISGGVIAVDEASASFTVPVTSVQIGGVDIINKVNSDANSSTNIIITTSASVNPDSSISSIRLYPAQTGFSNLSVGQQIANRSGYGASVVVGQKVTHYQGNACALIGAEIFNSGNGNAVFGRRHISKKNRWFITGTGHDTSNGKSEAGAVFGEYANISSDTAFAIGNGTSQTARSNLFEIKTNGDIYINGTKKVWLTLSDLPVYDGSVSSGGGS